MVQKIIKILIVSTSFLVLFVNSCKEKDWRAEIDLNNSERVELIKKDHEYLNSLQSDSYEIQNSSKTKDEAIRNYLHNLSKDYKSEDPLYSFNKAELKNILCPNTLGFGTVLDNSPIKEYQELVFARKKLGESLILEKLKPNKFKVAKIYWTPGYKSYRKLHGYKPESIEILQEGKMIVINQIKQVIGYKGQFKVAIVAP